MKIFVTKDRIFLYIIIRHKKEVIFIDDLQSIYLLYADEVKKFLFCLTRNYDLSEELMQETFYQACKSIDRYNGKCKMSVWLCQIAKHLFYDYLKKAKHYKTISLDEALSTDVENEIPNDIEDTIIAKEQAQKIIDVALAIKEPYGEVFLLRVLGEGSFKEIGQIFSKSENWARVTFYRAKSLIYERVNKNEGDM